MRVYYKILLSGCADVQRVDESRPFSLKSPPDVVAQCVEGGVIGDAESAGDLVEVYVSSQLVVFMYGDISFAATLVRGAEPGSRSRYFQLHLGAQPGGQTRRRIRTVRGDWHPFHPTRHVPTCGLQGCGSLLRAHGRRECRRCSINRRLLVVLEVGFDFTTTSSR